MKRTNERIIPLLRSIKWTVFFMIVLMLMGRSGGGTVTAEGGSFSSTQEVPATDWQKLSQKRIYFGHQSVGNNILEGVTEILKANSAIKLDIVKFRDLRTFDQPVFAHEEVGKNEFPMTKIKAFDDRLRNGLGEKIDIAFLKFCFWDIRDNTDIQALFTNYKETIRALHAQYPTIRFIHFTVPLMIYPTGIRAEIKRMLRMPVTWDLDNIRRNELNALIRHEYAGREPLFDIAAIESTSPDGRPVSFSDHGGKYAYLDPIYSNDGGHLSPEGRKRIAEQFLITLARVAKTR